MNAPTLAYAGALSRPGAGFALQIGSMSDKLGNRLSDLDASYAAEEAHCADCGLAVRNEDLPSGFRLSLRTLEDGRRTSEWRCSSCFQVFKAR